MLYQTIRILILLGSCEPIRQLFVAACWFWFLYSKFQGTASALSSWSPCNVTGISTICVFIDRAYGSFPLRSQGLSEALDTQYAGFGDLFESTIASSGPLMGDLIASRLDVEDLILLVKSSPVKRREIITDQLKLFIEDARDVGDELQKFMMRVYGVADSVISQGEYTLQLKREIGSPTFAGRLICNAFNNSLTYNYCHRHIAIQESFLSSVGSFEESTRNLLAWANVLAGSFMRLEERLINISGTISAEVNETVDERIAVSAALWTTLGFNRQALARLQMRLSSLKSIITYHANAFHYLTNARQELKAMDAALGELRRCASDAILVGANLPMESIYDSLARGVQRLQLDRKAIGRISAEESGSGPVAKALIIRKPAETEAASGIRALGLLAW
ncbi:hypothetical protein BV25DRAFT_1921531 [Artomyces pyxidatus]|uniref:Uncharacterized protein n=1 Tax=Artomyces pyxidatus TaxID=48021 RepID=A0ACB8SHU1_9AGAM|nr:hypothetical protein BV25DRAFT_1921531 [Artomyces pyxidatus]